MKGKVTRQSDLLFYEDLTKAFAKTTKLIPLILIIEASYQIESDKKLNQNKLLWNITNLYNIKPADLKKDLTFFRESSAMLLELCNDLKNDLNYAIKCLLNDKKVPQVKKWFVDFFGEASGQYLSDWKSHKGHPPIPDFEKSYKIFIAHVKDGKTCRELGYGKRYPNRRYNAASENKVINPKHKSPKDLRYKVIPQGKIYLLYIFHIILYGVIDKERLRLKKLKERMEEILKEYSPYEVAQMIDNIQGKSRSKKPALGSRTKEIYDIIYPHPYDYIRSS